jgi:hypothetical protein
VSFKTIYCRVSLYVVNLLQLLIKHSKTINIWDQDKELVAIISTEATLFIQEHLKVFKAIFQHIYPESFQTMDSSSSKGKFKTIHLDIYNRFAEDVSTIIL